MSAEPQLGHWLCLEPLDYARGRNYKVSSRDPEQPVDVTNAFELHAESARPLSESVPEVWQYLFLAAGGYTVLMRDAEEERDGATAAVVWGLLLPYTFVTSPQFSLEACTRAFPPRQWSHTKWPAPVRLDQLPRPVAVDAEATRLAAAYVQSGSARAGVPDLKRALPLLCRTIERLAPEDRLNASFSTRPLHKRAIEADPGAVADVAFEQGLGLLKLWKSLEGSVQALQDPMPGFPADMDKQVYRSATLRGDAVKWAWLQPLLRRPEGFPMLREQLKSLSREVRQTVLSGGFEAYMRAAPVDKVVQTMDQMARDRLLEEVEPALLPLEIALERGVIDHLAQPTLEFLLRGQNASMATGVPLTRLGEASLGRRHALLLLRALRQLRRPDKADTLEIGQACQGVWAEPLARLRMLMQSDKPARILPSDLLSSLWPILLHGMTQAPGVRPEVLRRVMALSAARSPKVSGLS